MPPYLKRGLDAKPPSPPSLPLKPSYSVVKTECLHGVSSGVVLDLRWVRERMRGSGNVRSGRGRSEAVGTRAKGGRYSIAYDDSLILWLGQEGKFIYILLAT